MIIQLLSFAQGHHWTIATKQLADGSRWKCWHPRLSHYFSDFTLDLRTPPPHYVCSGLIDGDLQSVEAFSRDQGMIWLSSNHTCEQPRVRPQKQPLTLLETHLMTPEGRNVIYKSQSEARHAFKRTSRRTPRIGDAGTFDFEQIHLVLGKLPFHVFSSCMKLRPALGSFLSMAHWPYLVLNAC